MSNGKAHAYTEDVTFHVHAEDGKTHTVQDSPTVTPREIIRGLVESRLVTGVDHRGRHIEWCLEDRETRRTLDSAKSLQENGVRSGHHVYLRRLSRPDV
jgi:hypothetical protein